MFKVALWIAGGLWLIVAAPDGGRAEPMQGTDVTGPAAAPAPQQLDLPSYHDPQSPLPGAGVTSQIFTALGTVLGLLGLGVYLYKRVTLRGGRGAHRDGAIRILSRTYLGPKESLCLVQVGTDILLLGQTSAGITLLHTLPPMASLPSPLPEVGAEAIDPLGLSESSRPSGFAEGRSAALIGLESRLKRLNRLWGRGVSD